MVTTKPPLVGVRVSETFSSRRPFVDANERTIRSSLHVCRDIQRKTSTNEIIEQIPVPQKETVSSL